MNCALLSTVTSSVLHFLVNFVNVTLDVRNVCVFLAPLFSSLTTFVTYALTKELHSKGAGLVAASMVKNLKNL